MQSRQSEGKNHHERCLAKAWLTHKEESGCEESWENLVHVRQEVRVNIRKEERIVGLLGGEVVFILDFPQQLLNELPLESGYGAVWIHKLAFDLGWLLW